VGLGEAIVSGAVTPDTVTVNKKKGKVIRRETAEKLIMTVRTESGVSEQPVPDHLKKKEVLTNRQALELARYGAQIESLYETPMDIEWTLANGKFAIVQARPITSLPPEWKRVDPRVMYARGSFAEFVPDAVSPLFATLGVPIAKESTLKLMNDVLEKEYTRLLSFRRDQWVCICRRPDDMGSDGAFHRGNVEDVENFEDIGRALEGGAWQVV